MARVFATYDGFVGTATGDVRLHEGAEYDTADPLVRERPDLFTAAEPTAAPAKKTAPAKKR